MANILVVDDELGIRDLLSEILNDEGHTVELAENAAQARHIRQQLRPDLVLLDIWMPDTDGVTLLKEWQRDGLLTMPVVMMSGHGTIDTAVEATRIGAVDFLEKPIALQKLLSTVGRALKQRQAETVNTLFAHHRYTSGRGVQLSNRHEALQVRTGTVAIEQLSFFRHGQAIADPGRIAAIGHKGRNRLAGLEALRHQPPGQPMGAGR